MTDNINDVRINTLKQIEKTESYYRLAIIGAAILEISFLAAFLLLADLSNRSHLLLLVAAIAIYTILAIGLIALGIHINRNTLRVIRAIETISKN